ncbi:unnamed protein product [Mytilus coruscus]|uniref:Uncharacterized protein n=1 Tax=Mytilus coruscus TaxID=42192 RepID=A0A6J8A103_MYTCO|nr:unnamed protein product [Mytilus coruscus]
MRLQQYVYVCSSCEELVDTRKESLDDHTAKHNHDNSINFHRAFSDFIFRPGPGHIELNMAKCLLNFCWPILLPMVSALGFRTKKALDVVKRGTDHHRSKHILFTLFDALARELLLTHVRNSLESGAPVSLESFNDWVRDSVVDPNYLFLFDMCFTFLLAFKRTITKLSWQPEYSLRPLFFAGNHPKYQELHLRDLCDRVQYPPELALEMKNTESFSVSGEFNKGQGADFVHEETNKFIKSFLPPWGP